MTKLLLRLQFINSYVLIAISSVFAVFSLGFMTDFFTLFVEGNSDMYSYYKDVQNLNNLTFSLALIALMLALLTLSFDLNKQAPGVFGFGYSLVIAVVNTVSTIRVFPVNSHYMELYSQFDFSEIADYRASTLPFTLVYGFFTLILLASVTLFALACINFLRNRKAVPEKEDE